MDQKYNGQQLETIGLARMRGLWVEKQENGYQLEIPIFKDNGVSYLPYMVKTIDEIRIIADKIWENKNFRADVNNYIRA